MSSDLTTERIIMKGTIEKKIELYSRKAVKKAHLDYTKYCIRCIYKMLRGKIRWDELDAVVEDIKKFGRGKYVLDIKISCDDFVENTDDDRGHFPFRKCFYFDEVFKEEKVRNVRIVRVFSGPRLSDCWNNSDGEHKIVSWDNYFEVKTDSPRNYEFEIHFEERLR